MNSEDGKSVPIATTDAIVEGSVIRRDSIFGPQSPNSDTNNASGVQLAAHVEENNAESQQQSQPTSKFTTKSVEVVKQSTARLASLWRFRGDHDRVVPAQGAIEGQSNGHRLEQLKATAADLGTRVRQQGNKFYQVSVQTASAATDSLKRLAIPEYLTNLCRNEAVMRPCPQLVLSCCSVLVYGGLKEEGIFKKDGDDRQVDALLALLTRGISVVPPDTDPHVVATALKQFLLQLPEPLLTYRLLPEWLRAAHHLGTVPQLMQALPAANANCLKLVLQTLKHVAENAVDNEMDRLALAEVFASILLWKPPPRPQSPAFQSLQRVFLFRPTAPDVQRMQSGAGGEMSPSHQLTSGNSTPSVPLSEVGGMFEDGKPVMLSGDEYDDMVTVVDYLIQHVPELCSSI